jgi:hypothetical protein
MFLIALGVLLILAGLDSSILLPLAGLVLIGWGYQRRRQRRA